MSGDKGRARPVPTVRLIISDEEGRILFLRRAKEEFGGGGWCLPGGKVEYRETVEEAAKKELKEETSFDARALQFLFYQDSPPSEPGAMHCINFYFRCDATGTLEINYESDAWAWIGPEEMDGYDIVFRNDEGVRRFREALKGGRGHFLEPRGLL